MSGQLPGETRGDGTPGVARRVIFFRRVSLTSILSISTFSRISYPLCSLIFNLSLAPFIAFFVSPTPASESPAANGLARIQQIKRKFVSPRGRSFRVGDRGKEGGGGGWERLINGLLAEGGCITGEKKISREEASGESRAAILRLYHGRLIEVVRCRDHLVGVV